MTIESRLNRLEALAKRLELRQDDCIIVTSAEEMAEAERRAGHSGVLIVIDV